MLNGLNAIVAPETLRDSLVLLAVVLEQPTELNAIAIMPATVAFTDFVFGLFWLLGSTPTHLECRIEIDERRISMADVALLIFVPSAPQHARRENVKQLQETFNLRQAYINIMETTCLHSPRLTFNCRS